MFARSLILLPRNNSFSFQPRRFHSENNEQFANTFIVFGLGNPSPEFDKTRHSIGKVFIQKLAKKLEITFKENKIRKWSIGKGTMEGKSIVLVTSNGFMNNSGSHLSSIVQHLSPTVKFPTEKLLILHDDINLPNGELRIKLNSGDGGQNGMKDIITKFGKDVPRLKIGVGSPKFGIPLETFVLQKFSIMEMEKLDSSFDVFFEAFKAYINGNLQKAHSILAVTKKSDAQNK